MLNSYNKYLKSPKNVFSIQEFCNLQLDKKELCYSISHIDLCITAWVSVYMNAGSFTVPRPDTAPANPFSFYYLTYFVSSNLINSKRMTGLIFNIKRYAIHDGPGIRVTFFMKGCPLGCWWCHNPEGIRKDIQEVDRVDRIGDKEFTVKETVGRHYAVEELLEIVKKDMVFIEESGGGVTFSGGEPLLQPAFLEQALKSFCDEEIHTAVDTSGYARREDIDRILPYTRLFLFDIKHMDTDKHKQYTGVPNDLILDNYEYILKQGKKVIIRIPIIPGFNDDEEQLNVFRDFAAERHGTNVERIDLLPYHRIGSAKYRKFGLEYKMKDVEQPTTERMDRLKEFFAGSGINVKIGG